MPDLRAGMFVDMDAVGLGAGVLAPVGADPRGFFNPNLEVGFSDHRNIITMNGDFHYDFAQSDEMSVWMGTGPAVLVTAPARSGCPAGFGGGRG